MNYFYEDNFSVQGPYDLKKNWQSWLTLRTIISKTIDTKVMSSRTPIVLDDLYNFYWDGFSLKRRVNIFNIT